MAEKKRRWPFVVVGIIGFFALVGASIYFFAPQVLLGFVKVQYERNAGVKDKSVTIDGYRYPYYEGGKGKTLVLIHGFGDQKLSFLQTAEHLTPHFRVILPEVQGFGATKRDPKRKYSVADQVARFHKFFQKLGIKEMYLGGNSMGGHISAAYALKYPKQVKKLLLLNAAGLKAPNTPVPYQAGKNHIHSSADYDKMLKRTFYKVPSIPRPVKEFLVARAKGSNKWDDHIAKDLHSGGDFFLNDRIAQIKVPTLVLWGDHDRIVLPAIGKLYHKLIKGSQWLMMTKCGHTPQYERPKETAQHIISFLRK